MFAQPWKATINLLVSVYTPEKHGSHCTDFHEIWWVLIFKKYVEKITVSLKSDKNNGYCTLITIHKFFITLIRIVLRMRNTSHRSYRENQNTHFVFNNDFLLFRKSPCLWDNVQKYSMAWQATDKSTKQRVRFACWIPRLHTHTHTHTIHHTSCFCVTTIIRNSRVSCLYVQGLYCYYFYYYKIVRLLLVKLL